MLNLYLRPLLTLLTLPITVLSLGFFLIVINAALLALTSEVASWFEAIKFEIDGLGAALLGALIISLVSMLAGVFIKADRIARNVTRGY